MYGKRQAKQENFDSVRALSFFAQFLVEKIAERNLEILKLEPTFDLIERILRVEIDFIHLSSVQIVCSIISISKSKFNLSHSL